MRVSALWQDKVPERDRCSNAVWALTFKPDGSQVVCACGNRVLVYDATDGDLIHSMYFYAAFFTTALQLH